MIDVPAEFEGLPIEVEIEGVDEATAEALRAVFDGEDEDVVFAHAFGGLDAATIVLSLTKGAVGKLIACWGKIKTATPKTKLHIGEKAIDMNGFSRDDILALFASPDFQKAVATMRK
jgi:hypothetical protein